MPEAKQGDRVRVHYAGTLDDGTPFDSSEGRAPLEFTVGAGDVIAGFDSAILGMAPGERKRVRIPADDAYGAHRRDLVMRLPRAELPASIEPTLGQQLRLSQGDHVLVVTISELDEEVVTLDANHPLAGKDLTFDLELVEIA